MEHLKHVKRFSPKTWFQKISDGKLLYYPFGDIKKNYVLENDADIAYAKKISKVMLFFNIAMLVLPVIAILTIDTAQPIASRIIDAALLFFVAAIVPLVFVKYSLYKNLSHVKKGVHFESWFDMYAHRMQHASKPIFMIYAYIWSPIFVFALSFFIYKIIDVQLAAEELDPTALFIALIAFFLMAAIVYANYVAHKLRSKQK